MYEIAWRMTDLWKCDESVMMWVCFWEEKAGVLIPIKSDHKKKEQCHSVLQRNTILSGLHIIRKKSPFNKITIQSTLLIYAQFSTSQRKNDQYFGKYDLAPDIDAVLWYFFRVKGIFFKKIEAYTEFFLLKFYILL